LDRFFKILANFSFVPIIGDGKQKFQPVAIKDIVHAVLNFAESTDQTGLQIVDGVGREAITQHEFYQIYADLANVKLRPIFLKPEVLKKFASQFPKGHLSEYAIVRLEQLGEKEHLFCSQKFEQILGRPTTTLK
jgi:nucleoside-diphosphate-sugar epimerase